MPLGSNTGERDRFRRLMWPNDGAMPLPATAAVYERSWFLGVFYEAPSGPNIKVKVAGVETTVGVRAKVAGTMVTPTAVRARVGGVWVTL